MIMLEFICKICLFVNIFDRYQQDHTEMLLSEEDEQSKPLAFTGSMIMLKITCKISLFVYIFDRYQQDNKSEKTVK